MIKSLEKETKDFSLAVHECDQAICRVLTQINAIANAEITRYELHLHDVLMALVGMRSVAFDISVQGKSVSDSELGEGGFALIQHLNVRRVTLLKLVGAGEIKILSILKLEKSISSLVQDMRMKFDIHWPELWT